MTIEKVLIVDDDTVSTALIQELVHKKPCELFSAASIQEALALIHEHCFDLILCSLHVRGGSGLEVLKHAKAQNPQALVVLMATTFNVESTVEAMQLGAFNYLLKPLTHQTIATLFDRAQQQLDLLQENCSLREEISTQQSRKKHLLIAESSQMQHIMRDVLKIAKSSSSVFISGESGTGKEMIAHAIHSHSHRTLQPFIKVNCAALPAALLESEFFGHEKGSFTGAIQKKLGRFELADKGTLLLDEISEIPLELQSKLLRATQEMEFERVGGIRPIRVDTRLISTSNRCMKEAIEQKLFREDLYYRLNVVPIHIPPLRERPEDILPLAEHFLACLCKDNQKPLKRLTSSARQKLTDYYWPGNIRELANVIERTVVMNSSEVIEAHQLYIDLSCPIKEAPSTPFPVGVTLAELEKRLIFETLSREHNNRNKTAQVLGISVRTLRNKLHAYRN